MVNILQGQNQQVLFYVMQHDGIKILCLYTYILKKKNTFIAYSDFKTFY
jgi:hypothetical protein